MSEAIDKVILFTNGMVMAFDKNGEQLPEFQGEYGHVVNHICDNYTGLMELAQWTRDSGNDGPPWLVLALFLPVRV